MSISNLLYQLYLFLIGDPVMVALKYSTWLLSCFVFPNLMKIKDFEIFIEIEIQSVSEMSYISFLCSLKRSKRYYDKNKFVNYEKSC